jgi:hypothetical protein
MADTNLLVLAREYKKLREEVKKVLSMPKGDKGDRGEKGNTGDAGSNGFPGRDGKDGVNGFNGADGQNGKDGVDGKDGLDGVGVQNAYLDFDNALVIVLTDGREINAGYLDQEAKEAVVATFKQGAQTLDQLLPKNDTITGWLYSGNTFSIAGQESAPTGLFIGSAGTKMYVNGSTGDDVNEYTLGTAWDITTATFVTVFSTAAQDAVPVDLFFKPDGLSMFIMGGNNDIVYQYTLGTAWSVATASYASKSFNVGTQEASPSGLWFKPDGTVMYVIGSVSDAVYQYTLSTAWDVSTASYGGIFYSVAAQDLAPTQVNLSNDGLKMWLLGSTGDDIWEYNLGTAWNVSTATPVNNFYIGFQDVTPNGLFIDSTAINRVYMVGSTTDAVFQYNTTNNAVKLDTSSLDVDGALRANGNFVAGQNAYVDGTLGVQGATTLGTTTLGSITITGSINASTNTNNYTLGTAQTTGTWAAGGTSQTGAITLGQSTVSQTTNIQAGATASGSTKTINFGTAGLSGSTTTIAIGSAVSGATSTTTLNGLVINSIFAAVSAAGATQGTATALVSNINNVTVVAAGANGVRLPTAVAGMRILVRNSDAADALNIYPATGGAINALAANAAFSLAAGLTIELVATTATQWFTF